MGEMKKKRARGRHARGEGAPARKAPAPSPLACLPRARFFFHFAHLFPSACYAG